MGTTASREAITILEQLLRLLPTGDGDKAPGWLAAAAGLPAAVASAQAAPARGAGGAEPPPAATAAQQQQQGLRSDRGRQQSRSRSRSQPHSPLLSSRSHTRSPSPEAQLVRRLSSRGGASSAAGPGSARSRRRGGSGSPPPLRRRTPSPWRTVQRQRSPSPWRTAQRQRSPSPWRTTQRQRSSSPWGRSPPAGEQRDGQLPRRTGCALASLACGRTGGAVPSYCPFMPLYAPQAALYAAHYRHLCFTACCLLSPLPSLAGVAALSCRPRPSAAGAAWRPAAQEMATLPARRRVRRCRRGCRQVRYGWEGREAASVGCHDNYLAAICLRPLGPLSHFKLFLLLWAAYA